MSAAYDIAEIQRLDVENDPTILSKILHQYYSITEFLLETPDSAISGIQPTLVRDFKNTYHDSVLFCRYRPCTRASIAFLRTRDRDKHESSHTRKLKCGDSACEFYDSGFSTKAALQKHNEVYHRKMSDFVLPIRRRQNATDLRESFLDSRGPQLSPDSNVTTSQRQLPLESISSKGFRRLNVLDGIHHLRKEGPEANTDYLADLHKEALRRAKPFHNFTVEASQSSEDRQQPLVSGKKLSLSDYKEKVLSKSILRQKIHVQNTPLSNQPQLQRIGQMNARTLPNTTHPALSDRPPFTQTGNMTPPFFTNSRRENPVEAWDSQDQPFNSYTFSRPPPQIQRLTSERKPELEQVPELDSFPGDNPGDNPGDFFLRTGMTGTPILQLPPSRMTMQATQPRHQLSTRSRRSYNISAPPTPTSDSLTVATTQEERAKTPEKADLLWTPEIEAEIERWQQTGSFPFPDLYLCPAPSPNSFSFEALRLIHHVASVWSELGIHDASNFTIWTRQIPL
jgi:hypothetical protein